MQQLQLLFDTLLASAHYASAEAIMHNCRSISRKKWNNQSRNCIKTPHSDAMDSFPVWTEERLLKLDTSMGSVHASILCTRSVLAFKTLAIEFHYGGNERLKL